MTQIFLLSYITFTTSLFAASTPVFVKGFFAGCPYQVVLYSLDPYISEGGWVAFSSEYPKEADSVVSALLSRTSRDGKGSVVFKYISVDDYIKYDPARKTSYIKDYNVRVARSLEIAKKHENSGIYKVKNKNLGGEFRFDNKIVRVDDVLVPTMYASPDYLAGEDIEVHHRANLFDMLTQDIDEHILSHGMAQIISKNDEDGKKRNQLEISIFCTIEMKMPDKSMYRIAGFLQYTFDEVAGWCYHRAFKPLTRSHMRYLSNNPLSSCILKCAAQWLIQDAVEKCETRTASVFRKFLQKLGDVTSEGSKLIMAFKG